MKRIWKLLIPALFALMSFTAQAGLTNAVPNTNYVVSVHAYGPCCPTYSAIPFTDADVVTVAMPGSYNLTILNKPAHLLRGSIRNFDLAITRFEVIDGAGNVIATHTAEGVLNIPWLDAGTYQVRITGYVTGTNGSWGNYGSYSFLLAGPL